VTELFFVVEGDTEVDFVNQILVEHLAYTNVMVRRVAKVGRGKQSGGMVSYARLRDHLELLMKQHRGVYFTTLIDVFRIPTDFPEFQMTNKISDPVSRAAKLEQAMLEDVIARTGTRFFVPYVQLHEFEALLFTDPSILDSQLTEVGAKSKLKELIAVRKQYETPEHINTRPETAPSKRLEALYGRAYQKILIGRLVTEKIGLERLREACPRFGAWVTKLEQLGQK
jgi:Domain of unknown function (DUF4276)